MTIKWTILSPSEFEELCYTLMEANGFQELFWLGKGGGDKGRDIIAKKETSYTERTKRTESWIIQCKRYSKQPPGVTQISSLLEQCREHKPDNVLIIITNTLSANTKDWIISIQQEYRFRIHIWEEMDLLWEMRSHRDNLSPKAAELLTHISLPPNVPVLFSQMSESTVFYATESEEFTELGIFILNDYGHKHNIEMIKGFVEYLRNHDIEFMSYEEEEERRMKIQRFRRLQYY